MEISEGNNILQQSRNIKTTYESSLKSCSLDELKNFLPVIESSKETLENKLKEICSSEYQTFINAYEVLEYSNNELKVKIGKERIEELIDLFIPNIENVGKSISDGKKEIEELKNLKLVYSNYSKIMEIMEIPSIMEICVRNRYYEDALLLSNHVSRLALRYPKVKIINVISKQVESFLKIMLTQIQNLLKGPISLHTCIRLVGYLRRMNIFGETELRVLFLEARHSFLSSSLSNSTRNIVSDSSAFLKVYIDISRTSLVDLVSQFSAIFSDSIIQDDISSSSILSSYIMNVVPDIKRVFEEHLSRINDVLIISNILTQFMHFGTALSRKGMDMRQLVANVFESRVVQIFSKLVYDGVDCFIRDLEGNGMKNMAINDDLRGKRENNNNNKPFAPPLELLDYPALSLLTNAYLSAFNALRQLPFISIFDPVGLIISKSIMNLFEYIRKLDFLPDRINKNNNNQPEMVNGTHSNSLESPYSTDQQKAHEDLCTIFVNVFIPFISKCFVEGVYGNVGKLL
jgi:hypothetical protein